MVDRKMLLAKITLCKLIAAVVSFTKTNDNIEDYAFAIIVLKDSIEICTIKKKNLEFFTAKKGYLISDKRNRVFLSKKKFDIDTTGFVHCICRENNERLSLECEFLIDNIYNVLERLEKNADNEDSFVDFDNNLEEEAEKCLTTV